MMHAGADRQVRLRTTVHIDCAAWTPRSIKNLLVLWAGAWLEAHVVQIQLTQTTMCDSRCRLLAFFHGKGAERIALASNILQLLLSLHAHPKG